MLDCLHSKGGTKYSIPANCTSPRRRQAGTLAGTPTHNPALPTLVLLVQVTYSLYSILLPPYFIKNPRGSMAIVVDLDGAGQPLPEPAGPELASLSLENDDEDARMIDHAPPPLSTLFASFPWVPIFPLSMPIPVPL